MRAFSGQEQIGDGSGSSPGSALDDRLRTRPLVEKQLDLHHVDRNTRFRQTTYGEVCIRFADANDGLRFLVGDDGGIEEHA